jgi:TonB-dependent receptor
MNYRTAVNRRYALPFRLLRSAASLFSGFALILALNLAHGQTSSTGSITGSVVSAETRNGLQGATVTVPALNRTEFTDNSGSFLLQNLPAGTVELSISYSGFNEEKRSVTVRAGEATRFEASMKPAPALMMDAFTVATEREGAALSITEQRNAANIKNVTALDEWGNLPTLSIAELAMRLPGISFTTDEDNVVNNVSIRGMAPGFTRLNVDGMSSTGVGGDGRSATLHSFSGAMYEQIEIIAGQTPERRADGLGGQLNLKTRSPLSMSEKRRFNYNVSARWAPSFAQRTQQRADHPIHPVFSLNYQEVFSVLGGDRNLGIAINTSYTEGVNVIATDTLLYPTTAVPNLFPDPLGPVAPFTDYQNVTGLNHRFIRGFSLRADYRYSPQSKFGFSFIFNAGSEPFYDRTRVNTWTSTASIAATTAGVAPGFTADRTEIRPVAASVSDLEMWQFSFISKNPTGTVSGEHNFGRLKLDYAARWSNTHWNSGARRDRTGGQLTMRAPGIGMVLDKSNLDGRVFTQTAGNSIYDPNSYTANIVYTKRDTITDTNEVSGTFNAQYLLPFEHAVTLKSGVDTVNRRVNNRQVSPRRWNRVANPAGPAGALLPLSGFAKMTLSRFEEQHGGRLPTFAPDSIHSELSNPALWTEDLNFAATQPYTNRRILEEGVDAGYFQAATRLWGKLHVLGGVRAERVSVDTFTYVRYRTTAAAIEADPFRRAQIDYGAQTTDGDYTKLFPSVHFAYDLTANIKTRASWSTSYGRPGLADLVPAVTFNDQAMTVSAGNPGLKPQLAKNIDVKLEYYFKQTGVFTIGLFKKDIKDYIITRGGEIVESGPDNGFEGNFAGYTLTSRANAGTAEVTGLEVDFRQRLSFLPGLLKGITLAANYTRLETKGKFTGTTELRTNQVTGFIPRAANIRALYNYKKWGASASLNFTGEHIITRSTVTRAADVFRRKLTTVTLGLTYKLRPNATVYVDANNIFEEGPERYRYIASRTQTQTWGPMTINFGLSGQF